MRQKFFAVKFNDTGRCRTSKISKAEVLVTNFEVLKLLTSLTKSSISDSTDVLDTPLPVRSLQNVKC